MDAFVGFLGGGEKLCEAGVLAEKKREDSGGHGVEGAEVSDGAFGPVARRTISTTSCEVSPAGLSIIRSPFTAMPAPSCTTQCALAIVSLREGLEKIVLPDGPATRGAVTS